MAGAKEVNGGSPVGPVGLLLLPICKETPCAANPVSAFHTSLAVHFCLTGTSSSYVTN